MFAPAFASCLACDAVQVSIANLTRFLRALQGEIAGTATALTLALAAMVLIFRACVSEELTRSAVKQ